MSKVKQQIAALRRENRKLRRENEDLRFLMAQSKWRGNRYKEAFRKLGGHQQPADFWDSIYKKVGPQPMIEGLRPIGQTVAEWIAENAIKEDVEKPRVTDITINPIRLEISADELGRLREKLNLLFREKYTGEIIDATESTPASATDKENLTVAPTEYNPQNLIN